MDNTLAIQCGVLDSSIALGDRWVDTVFDLASKASIVSSTRCTAVPSSENEWTWEFVSHYDVVDRQERWVIGRDGTPILQEILPFYVAIHKDHPHAFSGAKETVESAPDAFLVRVPDPPLKGGEVVVRFDSSYAPHESAVGFYDQKDGAWRLRPVLGRDKLI